MVELDAVIASNTKLTSKPLVAVFAGATSGIGEYTIRNLARLVGSTATASSLRAYLIGRNDTTANKILDDCRTSCPEGDFRFIQAKDLSLLRNVDDVCQEIATKEGREEGGGRVDMLIMSQARSVFEPPKLTSEGIEYTMSLYYYSRARFIHNLMPFLLKSEGQSRVISIYAPGSESTLHIDDLPLLDDDHKNSGYFLRRSHCVYMKTCYFEVLAEANQDKLSLIHVFPGLIQTPSFADPLNPLWFKIVWTCMKPFLRFVPSAISPDEVGQRMLYLVGSESYMNDGKSGGDGLERMVGTNGKPASGAYAVDHKGEKCSASKAWEKTDKDKLKAEVVEHTRQVFENIARDGYYKSRRK